MMRAWAAISAAAVLVALPTTVGRASAAVAQQDTTTPVAAAGDTGLLAAGNLGVVLWLSVALVAVLVSFVVLRHSRTQLTAAPATPVSGGTLAEFRSSSATAGR